MLANGAEKYMVSLYKESGWWSRSALLCYGTVMVKYILHIYIYSTRGQKWPIWWRGEHIMHKWLTGLDSKVVFLDVNCNSCDPPWTMLYFSLHKPTQTCRPLLKTSILSDQSQHRAAAGLHSSDLHREVCWDKTLSGTVKQDSSRGAIDCHSSERGDWLPEYFALQTSHFLCTQTRAHEENVWRAAMSDSYACRKRWVKRWGGSVSRKVWWGSIGPPGQMAVPVGIRINPPKLFPCRGHQNAVRSPSLLSFSFCFIPPITDAHRLCSLTYWVFGGGAVMCVQVGVWLACVICADLFLSHQERSNLLKSSAWNNLGVTENTSQDFMHARQL